MIDSILGLLKGIVEIVATIFKRKNDPDIVARETAKKDQETDDKMDEALKKGDEDELRNSVG